MRGPALCEYEIEAELSVYEFRRHGAQSVAYNSIVAAGDQMPVSCTIRPARRCCEDGHLVLASMRAARWTAIASDITRIVSGQRPP